MMRSWPLVAGGAAILLLLFVLSSSGKKPPAVPHDDIHAGLRANESCVTCHGHGKSSPLKESHPPKEQCLVCHRPGKV